MVKCYFPGCVSTETHRKQENRHFFTLPNVKQADVRKKWLDLLGLSENDVRSKQVFVCDLHFKENDFERDIQAEMVYKRVVKRKLTKCATPTADLRSDFDLTVSKRKCNYMVFS